MVEPGRYGKRLVVTSRWSNAISQYILGQNIEELYLNYARGWKGKNLSFLSELPHLKAFSIIDWNISDISQIHTLHSLKKLEISTYCKTEINFEEFPSIEECSLEWRAKAKSIFNCKSLKKLFVNHYSGRNTFKFSHLVELESLSIANAPGKTLDGLSSLRKLKFLGLYNLKKLKSLSGIESLTLLEELEVNGCWSLPSITEVSYLLNLKKLQLCDDRSLESIKPLAKLNKLESFLFYESTDVVDGDLSPLMKLDNLSHLSFQERPHYSHRKMDFTLRPTV
ncbi:MAG: hypothetical protein H0U45_17315 [Tatlockia sp.]|nr:hypothetical protein [Tatlockia sp.]